MNDVNEFVVQHHFLSQVAFLIVPAYIYFFAKWNLKFKILGIVSYASLLLVIALCWG
jgi:hypothetical protein